MGYKSIVVAGRGINSVYLMILFKFLNAYYTIDSVVIILVYSPNAMNTNAFLEEMTAVSIS